MTDFCSGTGTREAGRRQRGFKGKSQLPFDWKPGVPRGILPSRHDKCLFGRRPGAAGVWLFSGKSHHRYTLL